MSGFLSDHACADIHRVGAVIYDYVNDCINMKTQEMLYLGILQSIDHTRHAFYAR